MLGGTLSLSLVCRELYGRGLIGSLKATTWYQQLQEKQNQSQNKQRRKPKATNSIRVQVRLILHLDTPCMKWQLSAALWKHYTQCFHCEVKDLLCLAPAARIHCIIRWKVTAPCQVETLAGQVVAVDVDAGASLGAMREGIAKQTGILVKQQRLIILGVL